MYSITVHILFHPISKTWNSFVNWTCEKLSHISATFNPETVLGCRLRFQNSFMRRSSDMISMAFKFEELLGDRCSF